MKNRYILTFTLLNLVVILFNSGCKKDDAPTQTVPTVTTGTIQGKVTNVIDNSEISNANVQTNPATSSVLTNSSGDFTISDVNAGNYIVTASKTGYNNNSVNVSVVAGKKSTANIQLTESGTAPHSPILSSPADFATYISLTPLLNWNAITGATSYRLQVSTSNTFASIEFDESNITDTSKRVSGLSNNTTYYWRVNASNSYGTSNWSSPIWNFKTAPLVTPCPGTPSVSYAGKTYYTVQIGTQCWLNENLDVGIKISSSQYPGNNSTIEKYCYDNNSYYCNIYGGLYRWDEAMQYVETQGAKGICPDGWHIPTYAQLQELSIAVGGSNSNALKAVGQGKWDGVGTNTSGFSALLAGYHYGGNFYHLTHLANFWSSTKYDAMHAYSMLLNDGGSGIDFNNHFYNYIEHGYSVRCLKD